MNVVLDTNILLDIFVFEELSLSDLLERPITFITTSACLAEFRCVLPRFGLSESQVEAIVSKWAEVVKVVDLPKGAVVRSKDAEDQKFLDLAFEHAPCWLISKDRHLLKLKRKAKGRGVYISNLLIGVAGR